VALGHLDEPFDFAWGSTFVHHFTDVGMAAPEFFHYAAFLCVLHEPLDIAGELFIALDVENLPVGLNLRREFAVVGSALAWEFGVLQT
jgi:hypothetical protein